MTAIDTALASLTIVKTIKYKGADEVYGNTYFFDGTKPASDASWKTLADAVIAEEKVLFPSDVFITSAIGHQAGQSVAVWGYDYLANSAAVAGTYSIGTEYRQAGNVPRGSGGRPPRRPARGSPSSSGRTSTRPLARGSRARTSTPSPQRGRPRSRSTAPTG
jgi:hypothetical protein